MRTKIFVNRRVKTCNKKFFVLLFGAKEDNSGVFEDSINV